MVVESDEFVTLQAYRAGHLRVFGKESDDRHRRRRLASAGLADDRDHLAGFDVERHAAHGRDVFGVGAEADAQVLHLE